MANDKLDMLSSSLIIPFGDVTPFSMACGGTAEQFTGPIVLGSATYEYVDDMSRHEKVEVGCSTCDG